MRRIESKGFATSHPADGQPARKGTTMNRSFEIVTDSCCNLTEETIDRYELHVLPLTFMADGDDTVYRSYLKGEKTDLSQFYAMMREGKVFRTSLPNLADTDTLAASGGQGLLVWHACQRAEQGEDIEEVRDWTEANKLHLAHWFTVDDLMFLWRGGRVSKTSAWAGTLLNIKPVMHVDDEGHLVPLEKVRGRKKSLSALLDHMERTGTAPIAEQTVFITHGDCIDDAKWLEKKIRERFGVEDIRINYVDPVIGAHSGPGTMALFFLASNRD